MGRVILFIKFFATLFAKSFTTDHASLVIISDLISGFNILMEKLCVKSHVVEKTLSENLDTTLDNIFINTENAVSTSTDIRRFELRIFESQKIQHRWSISISGIH